MNRPLCANRSPRTLCEAMENALRTDFPGGARRPYNHYKPTLTNWYFVPSPELPFFRFGKFVFSWNEDKRDSIFCALSVTKGLAPELASVYPTKKGRRFLMEKNWAWHDFSHAVQTGMFQEILAEGRRETGMETEFLLAAGYVDDPGIFDPYNDSNLRARDVYHVVSGPAGGAWHVASAKRPAMTLKCLNAVRHDDDWKKVFAQLDHESFLWVTAEAGFRFSIAPAEDTPGAMEAGEIFTRFLRRFEPFLH